jgi:hypothetical protein
MVISRVFCISERKFVAESITIAKNQELKNSELNIITSIFLTPEKAHAPFFL